MTCLDTTARRSKFAGPCSGTWPPPSGPDLQTHCARRRRLGSLERISL